METNRVTADARSDDHMAATEMQAVKHLAKFAAALLISFSQLVCSATYNHQSSYASTGDARRDSPLGSDLESFNDSSLLYDPRNAEK